MIFSQDRETLRRMYRDAWHKRLAGGRLSPLESQIADVIAAHPEYHAAIDRGDLAADYLPSSVSWPGPATGTKRSTG